MNSIVVKAFLFLTAFCFFSSTIVHAQSATELYKSANEFYKAKQFAQSAEQYEKILAQGYKTAEVYYNLGNCYYKTKAISKAILNYERAIKLSPDDEDIRHNLKLAELNTIDKIQPLQQIGIVIWWNDFTASNSSKVWGIIAAIALWIAVLVFALSIYFGRRKMFYLLSFLLFVFSVSFLSLAISQKNKEENKNAAVLMIANATIKSAPDAGSSELFMIHEGTRFKIEDEVGEWNKIKLDDGKVGWIEKGSFEKI